MMKYKRYIKFFLALICLFCLIFICVHFLSKGYTNTYKIKDKFTITEVYTKDETNEHDNYYITISVNDIVYSYQFYKELSDNHKLVKDVLYYDGDYKCLLPIFVDNIKVDFLCYKDGVFKNYHEMIKEDEELDNYISQVKKENYQQKYFDDSVENGTKKDKVIYYNDNIPKNYIVSLTTLKGVTTIQNNKTSTVELFNSDIYKREISTFAHNYYVTANYKDKQTFREIYAVNILDGKKHTLKAPDYISFDSYIQGVVDNDVYIYDRNNEKQYKIDLDKLSISAIGNANRGIRYYNGKWDYITTIRANNGVLFTNSDEVFDEYAYYYKDGNKLSGFYYFFKEIDNGYEVYRANVQNKKLIKYLFNVSKYQDVVFEEDYVFFKDADSIKMYSDYTGIKTLVTDSELDFNNNILFDVYKK